MRRAGLNGENPDMNNRAFESAELAGYRRALELRREQLNRLVPRLRVVNPWMIDFVGCTTERDVDSHCLRMQRQMLADTDAALSRISHGTFGVCTLCCREILASRLRAAPATKLCDSCATAGARASASGPVSAVEGV
jgi:RNA polymerase-binding transcription factor DksA